MHVPSLPSFDLTLGNFQVHVDNVFAVRHSLPADLVPHDISSCTSIVTDMPTSQFTLFTLRITKLAVTTEPSKAIYDYDECEFEVFTFQCTTAQEAVGWVRRINLAVFPKTDGQHPRKSPLIIVNPVSGTGQAMDMYLNTVQPMLEIAGMQPTLMETRAPKHAQEIGATVNTSEFDAFVIISGDGVVQDFVNGLCQRVDWKEATQIALAVIPGGSGNAFTMHLSCYNPLLATMNVITGQALPFDALLTVLPGGRKIVSPLVFTWAFSSDTIRESEYLRWMGRSRYFTVGAWRTFFLRHYEGDLWYLKAHSASGDSSVRNDSAFGMDVMSDKDKRSAASTPLSVLYEEEVREEGYDDVIGPPSRYSAFIEMDPFESKWVKRSGKFVNLLVGITDNVYSRNDRLAKGHAKLIAFVDTESYMDAVKAFNTMDVDGRDDVIFDDVKAVVLDCVGEDRGWFSYSGEDIVPGSRVCIEVLSGFLNVLRPKWHVDYKELTGL